MKDPAIAANGKHYSNGLGREVFTIGMVAKLARVAPRTASKWYEKGYFEEGCYKIDRDRRITRKGVIAGFLRMGIPLPSYLQSEILLCGVSEATIKLLAVENVKVMDSLVELGITIGSNAGYRKIVIAATVGRTEAIQAGKAIRKGSAYVLLFGIANEDENSPAEWLGYNRVFTLPFDTKALAAQLTKEVE